MIPAAPAILVFSFFCACGGGTSTAKDTAPPDTSPPDTGQSAQVPEDLSACFFDDRCPFIPAVSHRGASLQAPENTLAAFQAAADLGSDGIELDVRTTADGVLVVMHDDTVDRTTDGSGAVEDLTLEEIKALTISAAEFQGVEDQQVPTFAEALELARGQLVVDVDVKEASAGDLAAVIEQAGMVDSVFLLTKSYEKGASYREANPDIAIMPNIDELEELDAYLDLDPELVEVDYGDIAISAEPLGQAGVRLFCQSLGFDQVMAELGNIDELFQGMYDDGTQVILTDTTPELVAFLEELNQQLADSGAQWP